MSAPDQDLVDRLAELAVAFGANVQPGQVVFVQAEIGHERLVRAIADRAYRRGAKFVDAYYFDPYVKRARILHAPDDTLEYVPPWYGERVLALGELGAARIWVTGTTARGAFDDLDPERAGRDMLPRLKETGKLVNDRSTNWTIVPYPTGPWAQAVHPDLGEDEALARLSEELAHVLRLDEPDPVAAWEERFATTARAAAALTEAGFDALHLEGPGTDLTVGLLPSGRWQNATFTRADGLPHRPNLPSEEVFTTPDPTRAEGVVQATKPLVFPDGAVVEGLRVRFEGGRAVEIEAERGAGIVRARARTDEGAGRLGEVALVDRQGRIGPLGIVFYDTLLDENAASHLALGNGFTFVVDEADAAHVNASGSHIDFMVGGDDVEVTGIERGGGRVAVMRGGEWQL